MAIKTDSEKTNKELEKLGIEIEKLRAETANLKSIIRFIPVVTGIVAVLAFCASIWQYQRQSQINLREEVLRSQENFQHTLLSEKELRRKYYEKQLETYLDLSQTAAQISTLKDKNKAREKFQHFLEIYDGNLIIVNTDKPLNESKVRTTAFNFKTAFENNQTGQPLIDSAEKLSAALRNSLIVYWKIPINEIEIEVNENK